MLRAMSRGVLGWMRAGRGFATPPKPNEMRRRMGPPEEHEALLRESNQKINIFYLKKDPEFYSIDNYPPYLKDIIEDHMRGRMLVDKNRFGANLSNREQLRLTKHLRRMRLKKHNAEMKHFSGEYKKVEKKKKKKQKKIKVEEKSPTVYTSDLDLYSFTDMSELEKERKKKKRSTTVENYNMIRRRPITQWWFDAEKEEDVPERISNPKIQLNAEDEEIKRKFEAGTLLEHELEYYLAEDFSDPRLSDSDFEYFPTNDFEVDSPGLSLSEGPSEEIEKLNNNFNVDYPFMSSSAEAEEGEERKITSTEEECGKMHTDDGSEYVADEPPPTTDDEYIACLLDKEERITYNWSNQMMLKMVQEWRVKDYGRNIIFDQIQNIDLDKSKPSESQPTQKEEASVQPAPGEKTELKDPYASKVAEKMDFKPPKGQRARKYGIKKSILKRLTYL